MWSTSLVLSVTFLSNLEKKSSQLEVDILAAGQATEIFSVTDKFINIHRGKSET